MSSTVSAYSFRQLEAPAHVTRDALSGALDDAEAIREAARAQGEAEGRQAAIAAVRAEAQESLTLLAQARTALDDLRDELVSKLEGDVVALGLRVAEQIVAGAIDVQPERLIDIAGLALRRLADRRTVTLVVNPADLERAEQAVGQLRAELGGINHLGVQSDRRVGRGGVMALTEEGEIDASVDAVISRTREIVADELNQLHQPAEGNAVTPDSLMIPPAGAAPEAGA